MGARGPLPAPAHLRLRRNAMASTTALPAAGRQAPAPTFPLELLPADVEAATVLELWATYWALPQAVMWERTRAEHNVARFVVLVAAGVATTARMAAELRQLEDRLGLSPAAMARLGWEITEAAAAGDVIDVDARPVRRPRGEDPRLGPPAV